MSIEIKPIDCLYHRYYSQTNNQPCYVELDCVNKILECYYDQNIGSGTYTMDLYHKRSIRWGIQPLKTIYAKELIQSILPFCEDIINGFSIEWDGSNRKGRFTEYAEKCICDIADIIYKSYSDSNLSYNVCDIEDYIKSDNELIKEFGITETTSDEELEKIASFLEKEAKNNGLDILENTLNHLIYLRESIE